MPETVIQGLTIEQYAHFSAEANVLRRKWEQSGGSADIRNDMMRVIQKYGQDPSAYCDENGLNYQYCGAIRGWDEIIARDATAMLKFSQIHGQVIQQAMFGSADESASDSVDGVTLERYAQTAAMLHAASEAEFPAILTTLGYRDQAHWNRVRDGFNAKMAADTTARLATHFGQLFAKYGTAHMASAQQHAHDVVSEAIEDGEDRDALMEKAVRQVSALAAHGRAPDAVAYLRQTFPDDADDADALDWYLDRALDQLGEAGNRDAARALLAVRYDFIGGDEDESREEWVANKLDMLIR
jgi:hypothetical protein